jgi:cytochrome c oxidase assembly protein subunit 15
MFRLETPASPWLRRFALLLAFATLVLLAMGGLVTSHGVGMAVPDWPNTYGYNLFAFPVSKWVGGILYEHSHRLMAALVGFLTAVLTVWLWARETRSRSKWLGLGAIVLVLVLMGIRVLPVYVLLAALALVAAAFSLYQIRQKPGALRWWGMLAFAAVILQGVLGGLRVVWLKDQIGIFHAALAQLFFVLVCLIAYLTRYAGVRPSPGAAISTGGLQHSNPVEAEVAASGDGHAPLPLSQLFLAATLLIFVQLVLGATMRHQHAGLAIPDFPLAYGKLWPAMDAGSITLYNQRRLETLALNSITAFQVGLQMAHRLVALSICVVVACCCWLARRQLGARHPVSRRALVWLGLILAQGLLGAATIWSNKAADIATAHVVVGALALASGTLLWLVCPQNGAPVWREAAVRAVQTAPFGAQTSAARGLD